MSNNGKEVKEVDGKSIQVLESMLMARAGLAAKLGVQFGGDRDLYQALGYKVLLNYTDFLAQYTRQDMAKAIIDRPVKATWQGQLELVESQKAEKTPFEQAWYDLNKRLSLRSLLSRVDRLTGIGRYGTLVLGTDDVRNNEDWMKPLGIVKKLNYVKPFGEDSAKITKFVDDPNNERYGMPLMYTVQVADIASGSASTINIHYSRVIHITDDNLESEIYGTPRLEAVFNRLMDLEKIVGGSAEMFWRGARPGYQGQVDPNYTMTQATKDDLKNQIAEYDNDLTRILINEGVDLKALAQQIADPSNNLDAILTCVSAVTGIPKRILSGSERGELASTQDAGEWKTYVQSRREDHAEPHIIRPFVEKLIEIKILPMPNEDYMVDWLDLFSISEKERVSIGQLRASAIREYTTNPSAESLMSPEAFFEIGLGLSQEQIDLVHAKNAEGISEEQKSLQKELDDMMPEPPAPPPFTKGQQPPTTKVTRIKK
jgi:hypothetical protein